MNDGQQTYRLMGRDRRSYESSTPGQVGGNRSTRIYGRLDCPGARGVIERGGYVANRVFFADEETAIAAGFRPCAVCLPEDYRSWKLTAGSGSRRPDR